MKAINFKTINGTLCRMVEPTPLTPEATFPCVVRLMQDDSLIGLTWIARCIKQNTLYKNSLCAYEAGHNGSCSCISDIDKLEIIGYPVVDGSAEWALYQMMQGEKVCNITLAKVKAVKIGLDNFERFNAFWYIVGETVVEGKTNYGALPVSSWISVAHPYGWQIHELEPKFKVGDWVEVSGCGRTIHGKCISTEGTVSEPNNMIRACGYLFNPDGTDATYRCKTHGYLITRKLSPFEVEVDFGFAKGRILSRMSGDVKVLNNKSVVIATIIVSEITNPTTRSLVESLLKAQKEEK